MRLGEGEYEAYEEYTTDTSSVFSTPPLTPQQLPRFNPPTTATTASTTSPGSPTGTGRLWNKARTLLTQNRSSSTSLSSPAGARSLWGRGVTLLPQNRSFAGLTPSARTASTLTLSRWDWKTLFYNWSFPLDQVVMGMRRVSGGGGRWIEYGWMDEEDGLLEA